MTIFLYFWICFFSANLQAQDASQESVSVGKKKYKAPYKHEDYVKHLNEVQKEQFKELILRAGRLIHEGRHVDAFITINQAEAIIKKSHPLIHNIKGSIYIRLRDFKAAEQEFSKALELTPTSWREKFNLAESRFVMHRWKEAHTLFQEIYDKHEKEVAKGDRKLVQFKLFVCLLKQDRSKEAQKMLAELTFKEESPLYYFANAAYAFYESREADALDWISSASLVFQGVPTVFAVYSDTLEESGWLPSLDKMQIAED